MNVYVIISPNGSIHCVHSAEKRDPQEVLKQWHEWLGIDRSLRLAGFRVHCTASTDLLDLESWLARDRRKKGAA